MFIYIEIKEEKVQQIVFTGWLELVIEIAIVIRTNRREICSGLNSVFIC